MSAPTLADVADSRDNNFNLMRMTAAAAVLVSHAYPIALGPAAPQPLKAALGLTLGTVAVYIFFAVSGFLITRSWDRTQGASQWLAARALRLFPALAVVVTLTVLALGPATTTLPLAEYFTDPALASYVARNLALVSLQYDLPGVFENNPYPGAINGSLWTLFYEVACYGGVMAAGLLGAVRGGWRAAAAAAIYVVFYITVETLGSRGFVHPKIANLAELSLPFALGAALYALRRSVPLRWDALAAMAALTTAMAWTPVFHEVFVLTLTYGVFVIGYRPAGAVRLYNKLGDYSYGVYIYAFPAQQVAIHLYGPQTAWQNMAIAAPLTLAAAILSWVLVEKPAMARRHAAAAWLDRAWRRRDVNRR